MRKFHGTQKYAITRKAMESAVSWCKANGITAHLNDGLIVLARKVSGKNVQSRKTALAALMDSAKGQRVATAGERSDFYQSSEWLKLRYEALKLAKGICECCGRGRADGAQIHVDHIKPRSKFPHLALTLSNLQILCKECNLGKGARDSTDWRDKPETSGNVVKLRVYQKHR